MARESHVGATVAAGVGLASLAAAMGIGRFAFTPIFPLMQEMLGVTMAEGAWLATANYVGYLLGACISFALNPRAEVSAKWGLLAVALATLAMGITTSIGGWLFLRFVAGVGSAFVLVGASSWALAHLARHRRSDLAGWVFGGVGIGICLAGLIALVSGRLRTPPAQVWTVLGIIALAVVLPTWRRLSVEPQTLQGPTNTAAAPLDRPAWLLVACYGTFGFGYIIPATFIPAAAHTLAHDPMVFGWAWPLFGAAATVSTVTVTTFFRFTAPRTITAASLVVMALGVAAPVMYTSLAALVVSAVCVGGTFMVTTMAAMQEARRISTGNATKLVAALTAAFGLGQLIGPAVIAFFPAGSGFTWLSAAAAALLMCSAVALLVTHGNALPGTQPLSDERTR